MFATRFIHQSVKTDTPAKYFNFWCLKKMSSWCKLKRNNAKTIFRLMRVENSDSSHLTLLVQHSMQPISISLSTLICTLTHVRLFLRVSAQTRQKCNWRHVCNRRRWRRTRVAYRRRRPNAATAFGANGRPPRLWHHAPPATWRAPPRAPHHPPVTSTLWIYTRDVTERARRKNQ